MRYIISPIDVARPWSTSLRELSYIPPQGWPGSCPLSPMRGALLTFQANTHWWLLCLEEAIAQHWHGHFAQRAPKVLDYFPRSRDWYLFVWATCVLPGHGHLSRQVREVSHWIHLWPWGQSRPRQVITWQRDSVHFWPLVNWYSAAFVTGVDSYTFVAQYPTHELSFSLFTGPSQWCLAVSVWTVQLNAFCGE